MHWADKCPQKNKKGSAYLVDDNDSDDDDEDNSEEINIVLITEEDGKSEIFVAEASKSAVTDTACTKTVAGEKWFKNYTSMDETARKEILIYLSNTSFTYSSTDSWKPPIHVSDWLIFCCENLIFYQKKK